ncbi:PTS transporter subunit EIIC [Paenibacillus turicensis]|uniref:PTS transporter subunit EIIC n=1 Tax=Paenibacillus turicensis TaxID=160487 RepID=UPI003D2AFA00
MSIKNEEIKSTASKILDSIGGEANIISVTHCMTRLRFNLKDMSVPDDNEIKKIKNVVGALQSGGQYQVIIGPQVEIVHDALVNQLGRNGVSSMIEDDMNVKKQKKSPKDIINKIFDYLAGSLTPLIPLLLAASLCKTIVAIIGPSLLNLVSPEHDIYALFAFIGDAGFYFLPVFLGWSAARKLNVSIPIAMLLGASLIHPTFIQMATNGDQFSVYGIPTVTQNYSSTVIPILLIVWIMSYVEKWFKKHTPDTLKVFAIPFGTLLIMLPISLVVLAPLGGYLGQYIGDAIISLNNVAGPLAVAVIGATFIILVLTGMHMVLMTYLFVTFPTLGYDNFLLPGILCASWAAAGVALACVYKFKNKNNKKLTLGYVITWFIGGVGEPMLYGLFVPYKTPLIAGVVSGGIAGLVAGLMELTAHVLNTSNGIYGVASFVGGSSWNYITLGITIAVALIAGFITMLFMKLDESIGAN